MANLTWALVLILCVDVVLFLGQAAIVDVGGTQQPTLFNCNGTALGDVGNCQTGELPQETKLNLPGGTLGIEPTTGNIFTDIFTSIVNKVKNASGVGNILRILSGPGNWLTALNAPLAFRYAVGALWYGITFFLIVSFIWGRQGE